MLAFPGDGRGRAIGHGIQVEVRRLAPLTAVGRPMVAPDRKNAPGITRAGKEIESVRSISNDFGACKCPSRKFRPGLPITFARSISPPLPRRATAGGS